MYFDPQMSSNPQLKSDFGNFLVDFCNFFVNLTKKIDLIPKKFKENQCPKMVSKRLYGHYLTSYEQFKVFQKPVDLLL